MSHDEDTGLNNEGDLVDNSGTPDAMSQADLDKVKEGNYVEVGNDNCIITIPTDENGAMSAEDEATLAMLMGDEDGAALLESLGITGKSPTGPTPEQVEEIARQRDEARTYDVRANTEKLNRVINETHSVMQRLLEAINEHATLEWNKAIIAEQEQQSYEDVGTVKELQDLNAVRFIPLAAQHIDQGLALLKVFLLR